MKSTFSFLDKHPFSSIEKKIVSVFAQGPELPGYFIDGLVQYLPALVLVFGILGLISGVFSLRHLMFLKIITLAFSITASLMVLFAYNDLKEKRVIGWQMVFWASNISIAINVLLGNIVTLVFAALISWYFLSQIRPRYK